MHNTCPAPGPGCTPAADVEAELARILAIEDGRAFDADRLAALARFAADASASYAVRTGALAAFLARDPEAALAQAASWVDSPDPRLRFQAALVLGSSTDPAALPSRRPRATTRSTPLSSAASCSPTSSKGGGLASGSTPRPAPSWSSSRPPMRRSPCT